VALTCNILRKDFSGPVCWNSNLGVSFCYGRLLNFNNDPPYAIQIILPNRPKLINWFFPSFNYINFSNFAAFSTRIVWFNECTSLLQAIQVLLNVSLSHGSVLVVMTPPIEKYIVEEIFVWKKLNSNRSVTRIYIDCVSVCVKRSRN
jgi:hypothetical protein